MLLLVSVQLILVIASMIYIPPDTLNTTNLNKNNPNDYPTLILQCTAPHVALVVSCRCYTLLHYLLLVMHWLFYLSVWLRTLMSPSTLHLLRFILGVSDWVSSLDILLLTSLIKQLICFTVQVSALAACFAWGFPNETPSRKECCIIASD